MAANNMSTQMAMLRANLGFFGSDIPDDLNNYLRFCMETAERDLAEMKIIIDRTSIPSCMLSVEYAAWYYRSRVTGEGKPARLVRAIHNAQVGNVTKGGLA